ncbi:MAG TPA: cytochrome C biogenesis protein, partial [Leptospiraceae bacterium]|nr:cytochrome C biogenesis protein [Leptospiraceae bacterium]
RTFAVEMAAGQGINPLLLHWAMIIHPPILYVGYVSFAIPFAITGAALLSGNLREDWLPLLRRWALFSWFFLGFGILLGSKWAYEELGWGGYWAWD